MPTAMPHDKVRTYIEALRDQRTEEAAGREDAACEPLVDLPDEPFVAVEPTVEPSLLTLVDLLLKDQPRLDRLTREPQLQRALIPKFLTIGMLGYTTFGVGLALVFTSAGVWPELAAIAAWLKDPSGSLIRFSATESPWMRWLDGSAVALIAAFTLGLIGAIGVCLPSFYFYGLLAGVKTTMLHVTALATKGMASAAIAVVGVLPIYVAIVLGILVLRLPEPAIAAQCFLGLLLPFIAGLWGTRSLYVSFVGLVDTMPADRRYLRGAFLRRLIVSWCFCFTAVTPVMIHSLWVYLNRVM